MKYKYIVCLCDVERPEAGELGGGPSASEAVRQLKSEGFSACTGHSPYVGNTAVLLRYNTRAEIKDALKVLVDYGYVDSVTGMYSTIRSNIGRGLPV
jgi:hypothetical protein